MPPRVPAEEEKSKIIPPPYHWSTNRRATVRTMEDLLKNNLTKIGGQAQCKRCQEVCNLEFDLLHSFNYVAHYILQNMESMAQRAPDIWMTPTLPKCPLCQADNALKPMIANKKRDINWLFLFLGQLLGCCTLEQLKYFCKHTQNHRTGAKDRVLYLTYLKICKQLCPGGPFDIGI